MADQEDNAAFIVRHFPDIAKSLGIARRALADDLRRRCPRGLSLN
jgi:hypothetical protein